MSSKATPKALEMVVPEIVIIVHLQMNAIGSHFLTSGSGFGFVKPTYDQPSVADQRPVSGSESKSIHFHDQRPAVHHSHDQRLAQVCVGVDRRPSASCSKGIRNFQPSTCSCD